VYTATAADISLALGLPTLPIECASALAGSSPSVVVEGPLLREEAAAVPLRFGIRSRHRRARLEEVCSQLAPRARVRVCRQLDVVPSRFVLRGVSA
jgi:hypothetical protein